MTENNNNNIKEQIAKLAQLQGIDAKMFDLRVQKQSFPAEIMELDDTLEKQKEGTKNAEEELKQLQLRKNEKETDMQAKEDRISKHEAELYQIKNNKEYTALQQQIDSVKADVSLLEEEIINLLDEIEAVQVRCEEEKKKFEDKKQKTEEDKKNIKTQETELVKQLDELNTERKKFIDQIDAPILEQYERVLENRGKIALSIIHNEFCSECNMHLRPQIINEATLKKAIVLCENCTRILYAED